MIIFTILIAGVILFGSLTMYAFGAYAEHKGYMRGMDEAEEILKEVQNEFCKLEEMVEQEATA